MNLLSRFFLLVLISLLAGSPGFGADTPPKGLVVFSRPPAKYPEIVDFVTLAKANVAFSQVLRPNGDKIEIPNGGQIAIIEYPPAQADAATAQKAATALTQIETVLAKYSRAEYPQIHAKLVPLAAKWKTAQAMKVAATPPPVAPAIVPATPPEEGLTITTRSGVRYEGVEVTKVSEVVITFSHASGIGTIALSDLPADLQKKYNYDPDRALKAKQAKEAEIARLQKMSDPVEIERAAKAERIRLAALEFSKNPDLPNAEAYMATLPNALDAAAGGGQFEVGNAYKLTTAVIQKTAEEMTVRNMVTGEPFGLLVFGDPAKASNLSIDTGTTVEALIRFQKFKDVELATGGSKRTPVFECLGLKAGGEYIHTSAGAAQK